SADLHCLLWFLLDPRIQGDRAKYSIHSRNRLQCRNLWRCTCCRCVHRDRHTCWYSVLLPRTQSLSRIAISHRDSSLSSTTEQLKILILAAEVVPFAKVGGLADVVGALPKALQELGHDVRLVMPRYGQIKPDKFKLTTVLDSVNVSMATFKEQVGVCQGTIGNGIPVYMIDAPRYFDRENIYGYTDDGERFILFCRAALESMRLLDWSPNIVHCNDWQTGIVPNWMHTVYRDDPFFAHTATAYTIHNLAYQGIFGYRILEVAGVATGGFLYPQIVELANVVDIMGRGILFADVVTTVSERYAQEILTP